MGSLILNKLNRLSVGEVIKEHTAVIKFHGHKRHTAHGSVIRKMQFALLVGNGVNRFNLDACINLRVIESERKNNESIHGERAIRQYIFG
jgi:hypothetical protein